MQTLGSAPPAALALLLVASLTAAAAAATPALGNVRLAGGPSPRQGQLQVQVDGQWYSAVCQTDIPYDGFSGVPQVVCRQLGFSGGQEYIFAKEQGLPAGTDSVLTVAVVCNGNEARLADCQIGEFVTTKDAAAMCSSTDYDAFFLGVACAGAVQIKELILAGGPSDSEGRVELRLANNSEWGTLCSNDAFVAQVVCRKLGYDPAQALARVGGIYGDGELAAVASTSCIGDEESLEECQGAVLSSTDYCGSASFGVSRNGSKAITGVRLADGPSAKQGRLQVQLLGNDSWHGVCFHGSGVRSDVEEFVHIAQLVCRSLGFTGGVTRGGSWYGGDPEPGIAELECGPGAADLNGCKFASAEFPAICDDASISGLACDGAVAEIEGVRLTNGPSEREGQVQVKLNGTWASVSCNLGFEGSNARVVCRQLGYGGGALQGGNPGPVGFGLKMVNALTCQGNETDLNGCSWAAQVMPSPIEVFSVACEGAQAVSAVRLTKNGTASGSEGRLEVQIGGQWGTVCGLFDIFDGGAAAAACAQVGYPGQGRVVNGTQYNSDNSLPVIIANMYCAANQTNLNACSFDMNTPDNPSCEHSGDVGLVCTGAVAEIEGVRLTNGPSEREGRVEVKLNGTWASAMSRSGFEDSNARVVCRQLGYGGGALRGGNPYGGSLRLFTALSCKGNETDLNGCSWAATDITGRGVLSVACEGAQTVSAVRVSNNGAASGSEGRLEVQIGGQWGTVCGLFDIFDGGAAAAACAQLGYPGQGRAVNGTQYSSDNSLPVIIASMYCAANQTSLNACSFDMNPSCQHNDDVGLVCTGTEAS